MINKKNKQKIKFKFFILAVITLTILLISTFTFFCVNAQDFKFEAIYDIPNLQLMIQKSFPESRFIDNESPILNDFLINHNKPYKVKITYLYSNADYNNNIGYFTVTNNKLYPENLRFMPDISNNNIEESKDLIFKNIKNFAPGTSFEIGPFMPNQKVGFFLLNPLNQKFYSIKSLNFNGKPQTIKFVEKDAKGNPFVICGFEDQPRDTHINSPIDKDNDYNDAFIIVEISDNEYDFKNIKPKEDQQPTTTPIITPIITKSPNNPKDPVEIVNNPKDPKIPEITQLPVDKAPVNSYNLIVHYIDVDNKNEILPMLIQQKNYQDTYKVDIPDIPGYKPLKSEMNKLPLEGKMLDFDLNFYLLYQKHPSQKIEPTNMTTQIPSETPKISPSLIPTIIPKDDTAAPPAITILASSPTNAPVTPVVKSSSDEKNTNISKNYKITVNYVDESNKPIKDKLIITKIEGESFKIDIPEIQGYVSPSAERDGKKLAGSMPPNDLDLTLLYKKENTNFAPLPKTGGTAPLFMFILGTLVLAAGLAVMIFVIKGKPYKA